MKQLAFAATLAAALLCSLSGHADSWGTQGFRTYRLQHAEAASVIGRLRELLGPAAASVEILLDRDQNQILLRGPEDVQRLSAQLIDTLDRSVAMLPQQPAASDRNVVRGYRVAPDQLADLAEQLKTKFPASTGVRIAEDPRTSQVIVIGPEAVHQQVAQILGVPLTNGQTNMNAGQQSVQPYQLQNIGWQELEEALQRISGGRITLTTERGGEMGVISTASESGARPVLRVDRRTGVVQFSARGEEAGSWQRLVAALDQGQQAGQAARVMPLGRAQPTRIQQAMEMIRTVAASQAAGQFTTARQIGNADPRWGGNLVSMIFQENGQPDAGQDPPAFQPGDQPGDQLPPDQAQGIIGDVRIEFIPELGVIVLRGNQRDVQRVQAIIDEIIRQSQINQPEIRVVPLKHSNSEALAALATTVYDEVYAPRQGPLSINGLIKPNALLLVGQAENITTAIELISKLDQPVQPSTQVRVFQLRHMSAVDAQTYLQTISGQAQGAAQVTEPVGLATRLTVIADFRSNSLIVRASPRDMVEVAHLLQELDVDKATASMELRIFPLKNALSTNLATVLQNAIGVQAAGATAQPGQLQPGVQPGQGQQGTSQPATSVQIIGIDSAGHKIIESGILANVVVTADANVNALVVRAPASSMDLVAELIQQLDRVPEAEAQLKVFTIENGDATNLTVMLQTLFGQQVTAGQVGVFSQTIGQTLGAALSGLTQQTAGESSLIPLRFAVDARTNSIIASGSMADLNVVEAILVRLDEGDLRQRKTIVYRLNNAPAQFVADALTQILTQQQNLLTNQAGQQFSLISQFELIDQQVFVVPEVISNTLLVSATPKYYELVTEVIEDLDRRPPMVMIQVVIAEVTLDNAEEIGVELGIQDSLLFDRGITATGLMPGFPFVGQNLGNSGSAGSLATRETLAGQAFSAFNVGRSSGTAGFPGLVLSASNESISILLRALEAQSRVQVLSRPQIMTLNNVPASILVGEQVPRVTDFQTTNSGTVSSTTLDDTGLSLGVIPRVTPDGLIIMDLEVNKSSVGDPADGIPIGVSDGVAINSPRFSTTNAITTISARSGQTVVFSGLITRNRSNSYRGVPVLSRIPVLGRLFRFDTVSDRRTELLIFMTPTIVGGDSEEDTMALNLAESERMSWCLADVIEMHGDPGFAGGYKDVLGPGQAPLIVPEEDVQVPSVLPRPLPGDRPTPGRPFIEPPSRRIPSKPYIEPPAPQSSRRLQPSDEVHVPSHPTAARPFAPPQQPGRVPPQQPPWQPAMYPHQQGEVAPARYQQPVYGGPYDGDSTPYQPPRQPQRLPVPR